MCRSIKKIFIKIKKNINLYWNRKGIWCKIDIWYNKTVRKVDVYEGEGYLFKCVDVDIYVNQEVLKGIVYEYILQNEK